MAEQHGVRNAQVTVIAPTGTIGLVMDCDTTGIEPDFALVKFKKLAGGGYFKIINRMVPQALETLGYSAAQIDDIGRYCGRARHAAGGPAQSRVAAGQGLHRRGAGQVEAQLPTAFDIKYVFNRFTLGDEFVQGRAGLTDAQLEDPAFDLFKALGFSRDEIEAANASAAAP